MYQSLYRKYRPQNFDEVVGQDVIIKTLKNTIKNNKVGHAYLFAGPRGTGKTSTAKIFAKTINCEHLINGNPCNSCTNCLQYNDKQDNDIIEIDAASNNGVDEIRELKNKIGIVPSTGKYKVYIIDEVHMLTIGAFNALLKTLEEPPAHVIFILATTDPHKIPTTILSRCQKFDFKKINVEPMSNKLKEVTALENIKIEDDALIEISKIADGGMRDALSLLDQIIAYTENDITIDNVHQINGTLPQNELGLFIKSIINKNIDDIFSTIDKYDKNGKSFVKITEEIIEFLRNLVLLKEAPKYFESIVFNKDIYIEVSNIVSEQEVLDIINKLNTNMNIKFSNNPRMNFELSIINIMQTNKIKVNEQKNNKEQKLENNINKIEIKEEPIKKIEQPKKLTNIDNLKNKRINNTLCNFEKTIYLKVKSELLKVNDYLFDSDYSKYAAIISDGEIKAANETNLILVYKNKDDENFYNENLIKIDQFLSQVFDRSIKSISVSMDEWEIIKKEFNNHIKKYEYMPETEEDLNIFSVNDGSNEIDSEFENIIEYN